MDSALSKSSNALYNLKKYKHGCMEDGTTVLYVYQRRTKKKQKIESYHFLRILAIGTNISISFCRENTVGKYNGQ